MAVTVQDVYDLARTKVGESTSSPEWMTDAVILPSMKEAYRFAARLLRSEGMGLLRKISSPIAVAAGVSYISRSTTPALPTDIIRPIEVQERSTAVVGPPAVAAGAWIKVDSAVEGFFPEDLEKVINLYDWREDILYLKVASQNNDIRIAYEADLPALSATSSTILIPDALDPLAKLLASYMLLSRDEKEYAKYLEDSAIKDLGLIAKGERALRLAKGERWSK